LCKCWSGLSEGIDAVSSSPSPLSATYSPWESSRMFSRYVLRCYCLPFCFFGKRCKTYPELRGTQHVGRHPLACECDTMPQATLQCLPCINGRLPPAIEPRKALSGALQIGWVSPATSYCQSSRSVWFLEP
jgi:hypothetical protein